jgi:hypothetical protein
MYDVCVWLHHGGSAKLVSTLMHPVACESLDEIVKQINSISLADYQSDVFDKRLFRIDTIRPLIASACFVVGRGVVDLAVNEDMEEPRPGVGAVPATCSACGGPARNCYFAFCGHSLYCKDCWDALPQKPAKCELCSMPIEAVANPIDCSHDDNRTCGICLTEPVDSIIVPCGHLICTQCGKSWFEQHIECPYCRESYAKVRQFVSYA